MTSCTVHLVLTLELHDVPPLDISLHLNDVAEWESTKLHNNVSINLMMLPLYTLHDLDQGVADEVKVQEQWIVMVIKDVQITSQ